MINNKQFTVLIIVLMITLFLSPYSLANSFSNQRICFISNNFGNYDLFLVNADGSHLKRLTRNEADEVNPVWSPDGKKILFLSEKKKLLSADYDLWVINVFSENIIKIDNNISIGDGQDPKWSPDSSKIIYVKEESERLKIFDLNNYSSSNLFDSDIEGGYPAWSPDGEILAYLDGKDKKGVYLISSKGDIIKELITDRGDYENLSWSPDGSKFAYRYFKPLLGIFSKKSGIYVVDKDGKWGKYMGDGYYYNWCPDNQTIAFMDEDNTTYNNGKDSITTYTTYLVNAEINKKRNGPQVLFSSNTKKVFPAWSPDGLKIAYTAGNVCIRESGSNKPIVISIPNKVLYSIAPAWGPDSENIIVVGYPSTPFVDDTDLFIFNYKDKKVYNLTNTEGISEKSPVWAPVSPTE